MRLRAYSPGASEECPITCGLTAAPAATLRSVAVISLRRALADIPGAIEYLGGPSRSKFYADLLPRLDVVRFGKRTFVTVESLDRLIAANRQPAAQIGSERRRQVEAH
jgi:hypothetical protein